MLVPPKVIKKTTRPVKLSESIVDQAGQAAHRSIWWWYLFPRQKRFLLPSEAHHGGAACNEFSSSGYRLVCGNGARARLFGAGQRQHRS